MNATKHTPGPWKFVRKHKRNGMGPRCIIRVGEHEGIGAPTVATINGTEGDCHLIAAAPEMVEALEACLWIIDAYIDTDAIVNADIVQGVRDARAALAKANGGA